MRAASLGLVVSMLVAGAVFVGGCPNDSIELSDMADMTSHPDTVPDSASPKLGCGGLVVCYNDCSTTATTQAEYDTCKAACDKRARAGSVAKYENALACGQRHCLGDVDAGSGKCRLSADMTTLTNADGSAIASADPGTAPKECGACLNNALSALFGAACAPTDSPDCKPAECTALTSTCLNEM